MAISSYQRQRIQRLARRCERSLRGRAHANGRPGLEKKGKVWGDCAAVYSSSAFRIAGGGA